MQKVIETHLGRKFTVLNELAIGTGSVIVEVVALNNGKEIASRLAKDAAIDLGEAVLEAAGKKVFTYEGSLHSVGMDGNNFVAGHHGLRTERHKDTTSEHVMEQIKVLIAIHDRIVREEEYRKTEEFKKAEAEEKLNDRRNELTKKFCNNDINARYRYLSDTAKKAVDYAIELEDKLGDNPEPLAQWEIDLLHGGKDN